METPEEQRRKDVVQADALIKQRTRYGVRPKQAGNLVNQLMARRGIAQQQYNNELASTWDQVVGPQWNQLTKPANLNRGVLEILVANSLVNQQLTFEKKKLLEKMKQAMPEMNLKALRFSVGNVN